MAVTRSSEASSSSSNDGINRAKGKSKVLGFSVETVGEDLIDCRLQIVPLTGTKPQWFQERSLSEQDEIVDKLIDAKTGRIVWTSHRPIRGWYLHLQLPNLPREMAIPLQAAKSDQLGCTPLSLCVGTRLDYTALRDVDELISIPFTLPEGAPSTANPSHDDDQFIAVPLEHSIEEEGHQETKSNGHRSAASTSSRSSKKGHIRRRSAAPSLSMPKVGHVSRQSQGASLQEEEVEETKLHGATTESATKATPNDVASSPQNCHLLLTDDATASSSQAKVSWARWAWSRMPETMRTPLNLDSSKTFSVLWVNAPSDHQRDGSVVEIIRFEDDATWWSWKGKKRGKLFIQEQAIKALRLDLAFWIALALAYLEFLEERDGYHAAVDG